jgi:hypothetical protein
MKNKIIALALIATTALSLVACGGSSDTKVIESSNTTTSTTAASTNSGYVFSYNGTTIPVDADAAPIIEALGEPNSYFESPSCAAEGIGKLYTYNDFEIQTYPDGDTDLILYVLLRTDNVATAEGIDLSSSRDDIIAAYGDPTEEATGSMKYTTDTMTLVFVFDGDSLVSIEYDSLKN